MRPSGLGWAPLVPRDWEVAKICLLARLESGHTPSRQHPEYWVPSECTIPWFSLADIWQLRPGVQEYLGETSEKISPRGAANSAARLLPAGTVVLSRTASVGFAGIMPVPMATTQDFANWVPGPRISSEFLLYALRAMAEEFERVRYGSTHHTIYMPDIRRLSMPVPPREEQDLIIAFLRGRLPKIDDLIAKKERLVALLAEQRQALITHLVTKGLDPSARKKDSNVPTIGTIPRHWTVVPLMHLTPPSRAIMYGIVLPGPHVADGVPVVKSGDCWPHRLRLDRLHRTTAEIEAPYARARLEPNDLVYAIRGSVGACALVPPELRGANLTQDAARIAPRQGVEPGWLLAVVQSSATWLQLEPMIVGATIRGLNIRDLKRPRIPVPPFGEQRALAAHIGEVTGHIDAVVEHTRTSIDRLREYRQALITAAVTGQLDVTDERAALAHDERVVEAGA